MQAIIALGSNMGQSIETLTEALKAINNIDGVTIVKASSLYRTKPVGYLDQDDFINAVIELEISILPMDLYDNLAKIELDFGRVRLIKNGPRTLDLDVISCDNLLSDDPKLILPHPRAQERAFVIVPMSEIVPNHVFADSKLSVLQVLAKLPVKDVQEIIKLEQNLAQIV